MRVYHSGDMCIPMKEVAFKLGFGTWVGIRQKGSFLRGRITRTEACKWLCLRKAEKMTCGK